MAVNVNYVTTTNPPIKWSPKVPLSKELDAKIPHYVPPALGIPVRGTIKGNITSWEKGELHFYPRHRTIPIVVFDSNGKLLQRSPNSIYVIKHGARARDLRIWVEKNILGIQAKLPLPVRLVFAVGGNDLTARCLQNGWSAHDLAYRVIDEFELLNEWCDRKRIKLTFATILPRPIEQDPSLRINRNPSDIRRLISRAFTLCNVWVERRNTGNGVALLPFARYVERGDKKSKGRKTRRRPDSGHYQKLYQGTEQRKIILDYFGDDGVHLSPKGAKVVLKCLKKNLEEVL